MNQNEERNEGHTSGTTGAYSASSERLTDADADRNRTLNVQSINDLDVETGALSDTDTGANATEVDEIAVTRVQIEETRAHMGETIDAIKEKLSPSTLMAEAKESIKEAASDKAHQIADSVVDAAKGAAATATDAVKSAAEYVGEKVGPVMDTAKEKLAPVVDTAKHAGSTAKDMGGSVVETIRTNPLPAALIGIGVGWLVMSSRRQNSRETWERGRQDYANSYNTYGGTYTGESRDTFRPETYRTENYRSTEWDNTQLSSGDVGDALTGQEERVHGPRGMVSGLASSASDMAHGAKEKVSDIAHGAKDMGGSVVDIVRENPLPAALAGLSLAWLMMSARRPHGSENWQNERRDTYNTYSGESRETFRPDTYPTENYRSTEWDSTQASSGGIADAAHTAKEKVSDLAQGAKEKVTDIAQGAKEKVSGIAVGAKEKVSGVAVATKEKATETYSSLDTWVHENPLAAGACALLIGAAVGMAIPATRKENEWFGHTRDELAHKAAEKAHDMVDKVQHVAQAAIGTAKNAVTDATQQIKSEVKEEVRNQGLAAV
jgi:ElaB/YqjD/DUF883 family membrane-anchored ribosome-binding protein